MVRNGEKSPNGAKHRVATGSSSPANNFDASSLIEVGALLVGGYIPLEIVLAFWPWLVLAGLAWLAYYLFAAK